MSVETPLRSRHDHVVDFYDGDRELVLRVSRFAIDGLSAGEVVMIVATPIHRTMIESALFDAGIDVASAVATGSLVTCDAAERLSTFFSGGTVDDERFDETIGVLLRSTISSARGVRVYGEMVELLWAGGACPAALMLESLWNDLCDELGFSLYCAYRASAVDDASDERESIGRFHSAIVDASIEVVPSWSETSAFAARPESAGAARRFVRGACERWGVAHAAEDLALIVSELSGNAIVHARSTFQVLIERAGDVVRIAVHDDSAHTPVMFELNPSATSGRGIAIVSALSREWGCDPGIDGKMVWAELNI